MSQGKNIEKLLLEAKESLPQNTVESILGVHQASVGSLKLLSEFIYQSEFELALDELEALGLLNQCNEDFWKQLLLIAQQINLPEHILKYKKYISNE